MTHQEVEQIVDWALSQPSSLCLECPSYHQWREARPYGSTIAYEYFSECNVSSVWECPHVRDQQQMEQDLREDKEARQSD